MLPELKNRYFGLRHGQSEANVMHLVVSNPAVGTTEYGLTDKGRLQIATAVNNCLELDSDVQIICSDYKRTIETAEIAQTILKCADPILNVRLRERYFGAWDMKIDTDY